MRNLNGWGNEMKMLKVILFAVVGMVLSPLAVHAQTSGNTPPPPPVCSQSISGQIYTDTGTSPATVYTCSYYNLSWQWVVNPSYGGVVYYPTLPTTCSGSLPVFLSGWPTTTMYLCVSGFPEPLTGGSTSVSVNGTSVSNPNFNDTLPAALTNYLNLFWQHSGSSVSVQVPYASASTFGVAKVDNTTITATNGVISATGVGGSGVQYNPPTTSYVIASFSGLYDDSDANSTALPAISSVSCAGSSPSVCTVTFASAHGLSVGGAIDMHALTSWPAPPSYTGAQAAQIGSFQVATVPSSTSITFSTPTALSYTCSSSCGTAYDASYWGIWDFAREPFIYGHGTVWGVETSAATLNTDFAAVAAATAGTPTFLILQVGQNDFAAGSSVSSLETTVKGIWQQAHAQSPQWTVVQSTMVPASYGSTGIGLKGSQFNYWLWAQVKTQALVATGMYYDWYSPTADVLSPGALTVAKMPTQSANPLFADTVAGTFVARGSDFFPPPIDGNFSNSGLGQDFASEINNTCKEFFDNTGLAWMNWCTPQITMYGQNTNAQIRLLNSTNTGFYSLLWGHDVNSGDGAQLGFSYTGANSPSNFAYVQMLGLGSGHTNLRYYQDGSTELDYYQDREETAAPGNPATGYERVYSNSTTHLLTCLTSSGANCMPSAASGGTVTYTTSTVGSLSDNGTQVVMNCTAACTYTLPATQPSSSWDVILKTVGTANATVVLGGADTYNGVATPPVPIQYDPVFIYANTATATDYQGSVPPVAGTGITLTPASYGLTITSTGGVTWPATNSIVVSNSTSSPTGIAPVNGDCVIGSGGAWTAGSCSGTSLSLETNSVGNASSTLLNMETSTANAVGLTVTPSNPSGGIEKWEVTGSSYTGTAANVTATTNATLTTLSALSLPYAQLSGTVPIWNQSTTGNAATATALASTPTLCSTGQAPTGILPSGNATGCAPIGGFINPMTTLGDMIYGGASGTPTRLPAATTPAGVAQNLMEVPGSAPILAVPGIATSSQTASTYTVAQTDLLSRIVYSGSAASTWTLPLISSLSTSFAVGIHNTSSFAITLSPTSPDTVSTATVPAGYSASLVGKSGAWDVVVAPPAEGTGTVTDGSGSTTANQLAVATATAHVQAYVTTLPTAAEPAHTGDVTNPAGSLALSLVATSNSTLTTLSALSLPATQLSGTLPAAQLPAANRIQPCGVGIDGLGTAITAGTYTLKARCLNVFGVTYTITGVQCYADNAGTSTANVADSGGNALLTGAITLSGTANTFQSGTQSATTTIASGVWTVWTIVADGTSKVIQCVMTTTR